MSRRPMVIVMVAALTLLVSCGGDDQASDDPSTTTSAVVTTTTAEVSASTVPVVESGDALIRSLSSFVHDWNSVNATAVETYGGEGIVIDPAAFEASVPVGQGLTAFAAGISSSVFMGGLRQPANAAITALVLAADPDGATTANAVLTTFLLLSDPEADSEQLASAYAEVADDLVPGTERYVATASNDFVITAVAGANEGDNLVFVVAARLSDESTAVAAAAIARQAVLDAMLAE